MELARRVKGGVLVVFGVKEVSERPSSIYSVILNRFAENGLLDGRIDTDFAKRGGFYAWEAENTTFAALNPFEFGSAQADFIVDLLKSVALRGGSVHFFSVLPLEKFAIFSLLKEHLQHYSTIYTVHSIQNDRPFSKNTVYHPPFNVLRRYNPAFRLLTIENGILAEFEQFRINLDGGM